MSGSMLLTPWIVNLLVALCFLPIGIASLAQADDNVLAAILSVGIIVASIVCLTSFCRWSFGSSGDSSINTIWLRSSLVSYSAVTAFLSILAATHGSGNANRWSTDALWSVSGPSLSSELHSFSLLSLVLSPMLSCLIHPIPYSVLCAQWTLVVSTLIVIVILAPSLSSLGACVLYVLLSAAFLTDLHRREQNNLKEVHRREDVLTEERRHAAEWQQLVANVAHDLKTPLSSFVTAIDIISEMLLNYKMHLDNGTVTPGFIADMLSTTQECLRNSRITNSFMLMTINRCLDYAKASKGLKLEPKYETIDLEDTLELPFHCMKSIQNTVAIKLCPLPDEINRFIITDKQWLQENVLCLLSNAVKYSHSGEVVVRVALEEKEEIFGNLTGKQAVDTSSSPTMRSSKVAPHGLILPTRESSLDTKMMLRVEVEDQGIGMSEEAMSELFGAFKQNQRLAGGTGLGLFSLAKRVEAQRGKCGVRGRRDGGKGSLFWFTVPYRVDEAAGLSLCIHPDTDLSISAAELALRGHANSPAFRRRQGSRMARSATDLFKVDIARASVEHSEPHHLLSIGEETGVVTENPSSPPMLHLYPHSTSTVMATIPHEAMDTLASKTTSFSTPIKNPAEVVTPKTKILLVDDSPTVLKMTSMMLKLHGYDVVTAENGAWALELLEQRWSLPLVEPIFDVILIDLQMPVMDGLETVKRLRRMEKGLPPASSGASTPTSSSPTRIIRPHFGARHLVIGLSANCEDDMVAETKKVGFDGFLPKPFTLQSFEDFLDELHIAPAGHT